jgi:hypothetical protein
LAVGYILRLLFDRLIYSRKKQQRPWQKCPGQRMYKKERIAAAFNRAGVKNRPNWLSQKKNLITRYMMPLEDQLFRVQSNCW